MISLQTKVKTIVFLLRDIFWMCEGTRSTCLTTRSWSSSKKFAINFLDIFLMQQYRECIFKKYSEVISRLLNCKSKYQANIYIPFNSI
ncbi:hypothetical protein HanIR_Chr05g0231971 [Helianthus annuus]|nr:hypothetical protein HanIR_Chr05g0231971 [Helianthus annuus]